MGGSLTPDKGPADGDPYRTFRPLHAQTPSSAHFFPRFSTVTGSVTIDSRTKCPSVLSQNSSRLPYPDADLYRRFS